MLVEDLIVLNSLVNPILYGYDQRWSIDVKRIKNKMHWISTRDGFCTIFWVFHIVIIKPFLIYQLLFQLISVYLINWLEKFSFTNTLSLLKIYQLYLTGVETLSLIVGILIWSLNCADGRVVIIFWKYRRTEQDKSSIQQKTMRKPKNWSSLYYTRVRYAYYGTLLKDQLPENHETIPECLRVHDI